MVDITIEGDEVCLEVQGWDKLWAMTGRLTFPVSHLKAVRTDPEAAKGWFHGFRFPGTDIPGVITAGTFYQSGAWVFYDVRDPVRAIVIDLQNDHYQRLIVEVESPGAAVARLQAAINTRVDV